MHLKALPMQELIKTVGDQWKSSGILKESEGIFIEVRNYFIILKKIYQLTLHLIIIIIVFCIQDAYKLLEGGIDVITDAEKLLSDLLSYPFHDTLSRYKIK